MENELFVGQEILILEEKPITGNQRIMNKFLKSIIKQEEIKTISVKRG